jgi:hypothetical protein
MYLSDNFECLQLENVQVHPKETILAVLIRIITSAETEYVPVSLTIQANQE